MKHKLVILISLFVILISCKNDNVEGIIIGDTLFVHQSVSENNRMNKLIKKSLNKDSIAIMELINFPNGGAASSYDLGYVITQIVYRIGEDEFIKLLSKTNNYGLNKLLGLVRVGLEYGDNDYDDEMDKKRIEIEFPKLDKYINEKL